MLAAYVSNINVFLYLPILTKYNFSIKSFSKTVHFYAS